MSRGQDLVAHPVAVEPGLVEAARGDVQPGEQEVVGHVELVAEVGNGPEPQADLVDRTCLGGRFEAQDLFVPRDP
jgi:hypothetical protein